jgi:hypothetical protein
LIDLAMAAIVARKATSFSILSALG